jgi:hypothetical protein
MLWLRRCCVQEACDIAVWQRHLLRLVSVIQETEADLTCTSRPPRQDISDPATLRAGCDLDTTSTSSSLDGTASAAGANVSAAGASIAEAKASQQSFSCWDRSERISTGQDLLLR